MYIYVAHQSFSIVTVFHSKIQVNFWISLLSVLSDETEEIFFLLSVEVYDASILYLTIG